MPPIPIDPDHRLDKYRDAEISFACRGCGHRRDVAAAQMARWIGWNARPVAQRWRFTCSRCGRKGPVLMAGWEHKPRWL